LTGLALAELETDVTESRLAAVRAGDHEAAGRSATTLAILRTMTGHHRDAGRLLAEAALHHARHDTLDSLVIVHSLQVLVAVETGDITRASEAFAAAAAVLHGRAPLPTQEFYLLLARGWAARARSDAEASALFLTAADRFERAPILSAHLAYEALRAGVNAAARLAALARRCRAPLVGAFAAHADARTAADGSALLAAADAFAALGVSRFAMEAAAEAAAAFLRDGRRDSARRAATRASELHVAGQGTSAPVVDGLDGLAAKLTRREAQIARLAGQGLTSAEIAEQLMLSVRTVEGHLYRAMTKRGVSDRREL
jgi:DNA-binding CsgD family transcriptional regulator